MKNIAYAGASPRCSISTPTSSGDAHRRVRQKPALMDSNQKAVDLGYNFAKENFECPLPIRLERLDKTKDSILIDGNTAAALGCLRRCDGRCSGIPSRRRPR